MANAWALAWSRLSKSGRTDRLHHRDRIEQDGAVPTVRFIVVVGFDQTEVFRPTIDEVSLPFLENAVIDFSDELIGARFVVQNPNATSSCGCGTSFSI